MTVNEIKPNMLCLEYRQEKGDADYGLCLWARFNFNLDRYELTITSDCGNYSYKWCETPKSESFLELMARCNWGYMLDKLYGSADIFNYEATKAKFYEYFGEDDEDKEKLDEFFEEMELLYGEPETSSEFFRLFKNNYDGYFCDIWEYVEYDYPSDALKIVDIFDRCIRPKIKEILQKEGEQNGNK